jgi:hypothetical protein
LTDDFCRVIIIAAINPPPDIRTFNPEVIMKLAFMINDIRLAEDVCVADIIICDLREGTPAHAAKFTLPFFKKLSLLALVSVWLGATCFNLNIYRAAWCGGNTLDLYSGGIRFDPPGEHRLC